MESCGGGLATRAAWAAGRYCTSTEGASSSSSGTLRPPGAPSHRSASPTTFRHALTTTSTPIAADGPDRAKIRSVLRMLPGGGSLVQALKWPNTAPPSTRDALWYRFASTSKANGRPSAMSPREQRTCGGSGGSVGGSGGNDETAAVATRRVEHPGRLSPTARRATRDTHQSRGGAGTCQTGTRPQ